MKFQTLIVLSLIHFTAIAQKRDTTSAGIVLQDVVVTGQYEPQSIKNSVYQVRIINNDRIRLSGATNLQSVLTTELGFRFTNDLTLGTSDVSLNGMSGQNVKVLLDGVPMIDRGSTRESINQIDINTIERIEIVEGPMSVTYGTDALAGVINMITKKYSNTESLTITARIQEESAGKEYNSFGNRGSHNQNIDINWSKAGWQINTGVTRNDFGGWQGRFTGREREWHPKDQLLGNVRAGYKNDKFNVWYSFNGTDETIKAAGPVIVSSHQATDKNYTSLRLFHQLQGEFKLHDKLTFSGAAAYTDYSRRTQTTILDVNTGDRRLSLGAGEQDKSMMDSKFFRGTAQYKLSPAVFFQPGVEININGASGARIQGTPVINDYTFFVSSEINLGTGILVRPGLRFMKNTVYDAPPVIPSVNAKIKLNKVLDLRLAYARGFRAPALRELYFSFFDASHSIIGNQNLKAEYSNSYNGSLSWQAINRTDIIFSSSLSGFYNLFDNLITTGYDAQNPTVTTYINIEKFKTTGGTITNTLNYKNLRAAVGFLYAGRYNKFRESDESLPSFIWASELNSTLGYTFPKIGTSINFYYKLSSKRPAYELSTVGGQTTIRQTKTAGFAMADASMNKIITKYFTLTGGIKNLFNVTRLYNTSLDVGGAHSTGGSVPVSYGRSFFLGINMKWTKN